MKRTYTTLFVMLLVYNYPAMCFDDIRQPAVAGTFYPDSANQLLGELQHYFDQSKDADIEGDVIGLVVPHAGYRFSATTAAIGYRTVYGKKYDLIVVMAPSHRDPFSGATIYPGTAYQTPLGNVYIDQNVAARLVEESQYIGFSEMGHRSQEHAIEVQLPFIQALFRETPVIPMVIGAYDYKMCKQIGNTLANVLSDKHVLFIASTDLYHGYSYTDCNKTDELTLNSISKFGPEKLCKGFIKEKYQACGGGPVVIMQIAAQKLGADKATVLAHTNSNDVVGKKGGYVVGYGAVAITKPHSKIEYPEIDTQTQKELLQMARQAIAGYLDTQSIPEFTPVTREMNEKRGVFVTLTLDGQLRGCIGQHESNMPLYQLVPYMAVSAAVNDHRFTPLTKQELDKVEIKVSVYLTNVYPIKDLDEFQMGVHGIIMRKNGRGATYLPQVPVEAGWKSVDKEMQSLCQKAGLNKDAWKSGAKFWVYKTQVFDESILKTGEYHDHSQ